MQPHHERHHAVWPQGRPLSLPRATAPIATALEHAAARWPEKVGLVFYDTEITYAEMNATAEALAGHLVYACGLRPGGRVLVQLQSTPQFVMAFHAVLKAGGIVVPVNPMYRIGELRHVVEDCDARILFVAQDLLDGAAALIEDGEIDHAIVVTYSDYLRDPTNLAVPDFVAAQPFDIAGDGWVSWRAAATSGHRIEPLDISPEADAVLPYTSGSTGKPRGCRHTHVSTTHATRCITDWFGYAHDDVVLAVAPFFHVTGMQASMLAPIAVGATTILMPRWDRAAAADLIERFGVTVWPAIPTMAVDLLALPGIERHDLSSIRLMFGGGIAMPEAVAARLKEICGITFLEGYGMTETMAPATANPPQAPQRQCGGIPAFDTAIRIADPVTFDELPVGEVGEVLISGPQVFAGYWGLDDDAAAGFLTLDGRRFFRSGDLGRIDENGYLFLVDRLKRMINVAGYKVWPAEIETALYAHPAIREVCVVGTPDARSGEAVKAVVVPREEADEATAAEILAWARTRMAAYKVPKVVEFAATLPRSGTGKIQWLELQRREKEGASTRL